MNLIDFVKETLEISTIIGDVLIFLIIFYIFFYRKKTNFLRKNAKFFALIISIIATLGSLFYSEIAGFTPCKLCWYQRIFMYTLPILMIIGLLKKDKNNPIYVITLGIIGATISSYHYITQILNNSNVCSIGSVSCLDKIPFSYGYITIPMMALTAFLLIILLNYISKINRE